VRAVCQCRDPFNTIKELQAIETEAAAMLRDKTAP
jgi:hypothetical protein